MEPALRADVQIKESHIADFGNDDNNTLIDPGGGAFRPCPPKKPERGPTYLLAPKKTKKKHFKCCVTGMTHEYFVTGQVKKMNAT